MHSSEEERDDSPSRKFQRAMKRARGKQHEAQPWEPSEHPHYVESIRKRRLALSIEDAGQQISSYFNSD